MKVTLRFSSAAASALRRDTTEPAAAKVLETTRRHRAVLRPQHANVEGTRLAQYFVADVPDADAPGLLEDLREMADVEAAYVKPPAAPAR